MHQQRLHRITGARTLGFGVDDDLQGRFDLGSLIDNDMAYADTAGDHRDRRLLAAQLVQPCPAARDQHVDVFVHPQHLVDQGAIRAFNCLYRTGWQAALLQRLLDHFYRCGVGAPGLFPAAQDRGITGFQAQGGDINSHVRARFVDYADHPQRHAATFDAQAAVQQSAIDHLPDRIGQAAHLTHVVGNAFQARGG